MSYGATQLQGCWSVVVKRTSADIPWGLRVHGGRDCYEPVVVYRVRKRSLAERAGLKVGDFITALNGTPAHQLTHQQILDLFGSPILSIAFQLSSSPADKSTMAHFPSSIGSPDAPALLAYIPANVNPPSQCTQLEVQLTNTPSSPAAYKSAYRSPPFRTSEQPPVKFYQPFDMTGKYSYHSAPAPPPRQFTGARPAADVGRSSVSSYSPSTASYTDFSPSAPVEPSPTDARDQPQWFPIKSTNYDDTPARRRPGHPSLYTGIHSCAQSRSFQLLELSLQDQGSGEMGLPRPPPAVPQLQPQSQPLPPWMTEQQPAASTAAAATRVPGVPEPVVTPAAVHVPAKQPAPPQAATGEEKPSETQPVESPEASGLGSTEF